MEREKEELRKYLESDSKAMKEKLSEEEKMRKQKEDELAAKMREQVRAMKEFQFSQNPKKYFPSGICTRK